MSTQQEEILRANGFTAEQVAIATDCGQLSSQESGKKRAVGSWGWVKVSDCPNNRLLVIAAGDSREQVDSIAPLVAAGRSPRAGEAPQVCPDKETTP